MASAAKLLNLLKKVHLNGMINACELITYEDGVFQVECIDERTAVFLSCESKITKGNEWNLGIGDIKTLIKWLSVIKDGEIDMELHNNRLKIISDNFGELKYLLTDVKYIATRPDINKNDQSPLDIILDSIQYEVELPEDARIQLAKAMSIIKPQTITLVFDNGDVSFSGGRDSSHQFNIPIGSVKSEDSFEVTVDGEAMMNVLSVVGGVPEILFTDRAPIVIRESEDCLFAVNTLSEGDE